MAQIPAHLPDLSALRPSPEERAQGGFSRRYYPNADGDYQSKLKRNGYVVIPTPLEEAQLLQHVADAFDRHFYESPEFLATPRPHDNTWKPVLGGFGALGNPSSFHHPFVRKMREMCEAVILDNDVLPLEGRKLEQCFDRLMRRPKGAVPLKESWHRDESENTQPGDDIFGGWINLDAQTQYFSCAPRTHLEPGARDRNDGFAKITDSTDKAHYQSIADAHGPVEIPPGHMLVFYERLVHEVINKPAKYLMRRMFLGWRATNAVEPLFGTQLTGHWMTVQAPPKIKSGQDPPIFGPIHANLHIDKIIALSDDGIYQPQCYSPYAAQSKDPTKWYHNKVHQRIHSPMLSLAEYGLPLHPDYEPAERAIMSPQRRMMLYTFDSPNQRVEFATVPAAEWQAFTAGQRAIDENGRPTRRPRPERIPH